MSSPRQGSSRNATSNDNVGINEERSKLKTSKDIASQQKSGDMKDVFRQMLGLQDSEELPSDPYSYPPYVKKVQEVIQIEGEYGFPDHRYAPRLTAAFDVAFMLAKLSAVTPTTLSAEDMKSTQNQLLVPLDVYNVRLWYSQDNQRFVFSTEEENYSVERNLCVPVNKTEICLAFTKNRFKLCQAHYQFKRRLQSQDIWNAIKTSLIIESYSELTDEMMDKLRSNIRDSKHKPIQISPSHILCLTNDERVATFNTVKNGIKHALCSNTRDGCFNHVPSEGFDECTECNTSKNYYVFVARDSTDKNSFHVSRVSLRPESNKDPKEYARDRCSSERSGFGASIRWIKHFKTGKNDFIPLTTLRIYCQLEILHRKSANIRANYSGWMHGERHTILPKLIRLGNQLNVDITVVDVTEEEANSVQPTYFTFSEDDERIEGNFGSVIYEFYMPEWCYVGERSRRNHDDQELKFASCHLNIETDTTAVGKKIREMRDNGEVKHDFYPPCRVLAHCKNNTSVLTVENIFIMSRLFLSSKLMGSGTFNRELINLQMISDLPLPPKWFDDVNAILMKCVKKKIVFRPRKDWVYVLS